MDVVRSFLQHEGIAKTALDWNRQGNCRRGRQRITWGSRVTREASRQHYTWSELKMLAQDQDGWRALDDAHDEVE